MPSYKCTESEIARLEKRLASYLESVPSIIITDNTRSIIHVKWRDRAYCVRLHHMFLDADETTLKVLAQYITGKYKRTRKQLNTFIKEHDWKIRKRPIPSKQTKTEIRVQGEFFDLRNAFKNLNQKYFDDKIDCSIMWGPLRKRARQKYVRLGSYSFRTSTIRINPLLDRAFVPEYVVDSIIYHEMVHHMLGSKENNGRLMSHDHAFKTLEQRFIHAHKAKLWIQQNLSRLLK